MGSFVFLVSIFCIFQVSATLPGFKIRLTNKGLQYANTVAQTQIASELRRLDIPDLSYRDGRIRYSVTGIENRGITVPSSHMAFVPWANGLTWGLEDLGIQLKANWRVKYQRSWFTFTTDGSVYLRVRSVSAQVTVRLAQTGGRPSVSMAGCSAYVGGVDVDFYGDIGWILNLFKRTIGNRIRDLMKDQICKLLRKEINIDANKQLSKIKVNVEIDHSLLLSYSLTSPPKVQTGHIETEHKGEVFWKEDMKEAPFAPKPIPALNDESSMMYLWVTDYIANSFAYTAQMHKFLEYNLTENDFPVGNRAYLNTTCKMICIGKIIPQIGKKYPNAKVEAKISSLKEPNLVISPQGMSVVGKVNTDLYAHTADKKSYNMISLVTKVSFSVKGSIVNERLSGEITGHSVTVTITKSAIGNVSEVVINLLLEGALDLAVIPNLNAIMKRGVDIPITGAISFSNSQLILQNGSIIIATDLQYI